MQGCYAARRYVISDNGVVRQHAQERYGRKVRRWVAALMTR